MQFEFSETLDSIDAVPEDFRGLYQEGEDGKFVLRGDEHSAAAVKAVTRLNNSLRASRQESKDLRANRVDLSALKDFGDTPEAILESVNTQLAEAREATKGGADVQKKIDRMRGELKDAHGRELTAKDQRIEQLTGQLHKVLVTKEVNTALAEAGAIDAELASPHIAKMVKVVEEDGEFRVQVLDEKGDLAYSTASGGPKTIVELVNDMKGTEKYKPLFKSESRSGGGKSPQQPNKGNNFNRNPADMSPVDKIKAGLANRR